MIILLARVAVLPGHEDEFVELSQRMLFEASRADEGCLSYRLLRDTEPENGFLWVEQWASQEALDKHFATPHFDAYMAEVPRLLAGTPEVETFAVASSTKLAL